MRDPLRLKDIIDLEYFFHVDLKEKTGHEQSIRERDRNIFLEYVSPGNLSKGTPDLKSIIKIWLDKRRELSSSEKVTLPGSIFEELNRLFQFFFAVVGVFLGCSIGWSFLSYSGDEPLNVFIYFAVFILSQFVLLLIVCVFGIYKLKRESSSSASILYSLITDFFIKAVFYLKKHAAKHLSANQRNSIEAAFGVIKNKEQTYGLLFFWPIFIWVQLFAVSFNVGLLTVTLFKVITSDIAFGWQSTIQFSPGAVHDIAQIIALPWSWLVSVDLAYPSLSQIEGSRIILKEGMYHLATPDLVSWWPFLCLSLLIYGLIPRIILFGSGFFAQGRCLAHLDFQQSVFEQLLSRMQTPLVMSKGSSITIDASRQAKSALKDRENDNGKKDYQNKLTVIIPDDIFDNCSRAEIESLLSKDPAFKIEDMYRIGVDFQSDEDVFIQLQKNKSTSIPQDLLIIQEAWQPPLVEHMTFLKELREAVGEKQLVQVGLIGKPGQNTIFTTVSADSWNLWSQKIKAIGDPYLTQVRLVEDAE